MRNLAKILLALWAITAAAEKRLITESDLYRLQWVADPHISPDGSQVIWVQVKVSANKKGYDTSLWIAPTTGAAARPLTAGPRDTSPRWSPDGKRVAFLRALEKDGKPEPPQIWLLPMTGGEPRPITKMPKGASLPVWAPNGRSIAFLSNTLTKDFDKPQPDAEEPSDVRVIVRAAYRNNGGGYAQFDRPNHIWTVAIPDQFTEPAKAVQVTSGRFSEGEPVWSPSGDKLYFAANREAEPYYKDPQQALYVVNAAGGDVRKAASIDGVLGAPALNPAGTAIATVGIANHHPERSYDQPDLFLTTLSSSAAVKNLTEHYDYDIAAGLTGDQHAPRAGGSTTPRWSPDGRFIYITAAEEGRANLKRVDAATGKVEPVTRGDHEVSEFTLSADGTRGVAVVSTPTIVGDLYAVDLPGGALRRLTNVNSALMEEVRLSEPEMFWYKSFDGQRIQTWVQRPPDFQEGKKYPAILNIHGGPHAAYGYVFDHEFQWMAAKGYVVIYPNPRGSTSYGQQFGNVIQYRYPGDDYKDLMAAVDETIKRGWVDPARMGVTGGSGGGLLTNWVVTQTDRFKGAVSQRSIADWAAFWGTADFTLFRKSWFRGAPWEDAAGFRERSPLTYVEKIKTPLLFIEGEADLRTPPGAGGETLFRALKYLRRQTAMVQFPGETHELSRSGQPRHRVERLQHIVRWLDKWVLGTEVKDYEVE